jgi:hypothetical protein
MKKKGTRKRRRLGSGHDRSMPSEIDSLGRRFSEPEKLPYKRPPFRLSLQRPVWQPASQDVGGERFQRLVQEQVARFEEDQRYWKAETQADRQRLASAGENGSVTERGQLESRIKTNQGRSKRAREWARVWREIQGDPERAVDLLKRFAGFDVCLHQSVIALAAIRTDALQALAGKMEFYLEELMRLADAGSEAAAQEVCRIAIRTSQWANRVAEVAPGVVAPVAAKVSEWPLLKSKKTCPKQDRELLKKIRLGEKRMIAEDQFTKRKDDLRGDIASQLFAYVAEQRKFVLLHVADCCSPYSFSSVEDTLAALPDFTNDLAIKERWWDIAEEFLKEAYPNPKGEKQFEEVVCRGHRKIRGKFDSQFRQEIKKRFLNLNWTEPPEPKRKRGRRARQSPRWSQRVVQTM